MFAEIAAELLIEQSLDDAFDFAITELGLGLAFELRLGNFDADDRGQPFTNIFSLKVLVVFF